MGMVWTGSGPAPGLGAIVMGIVRLGFCGSLVEFCGVLWASGDTVRRRFSVPEFNY